MLTFNWRCVFRGWKNARLSHLVGNGIGIVQKFVQTIFLRFRSWNRSCMSKFERTVTCCLPDQTLRTSGQVVYKLRNRCFQLPSPLSELLFVVSIVIKYSKVAHFCSCGGIAITTVGDLTRCLQQGIDRQTIVPRCLFNVKSKSSKSLPNAYNSGFPTFMISGRGSATDCLIVLPLRSS